MVKVEFLNGQLQLQASGKQFHDIIESFKYLGAHFDAKTKYWLISPSKLNEIEKELKPFGLEISEYDKYEIKKYFNNLKELKVIENRSDFRKFIPELLNYPPIKDFQLTDILFALNRNRTLFFHKTGMGKSYSLAALLTHLRYYGECYKAIILTSNIGVLNLPYELKKFIKNYDESKTLVISSITKLKDRLIFDKDYDIIICNYDTFRAVSDAYDKVINKRTKKVAYRKSPLPLKNWFGNKKGLLFLDECHHIGTHSSLRTKNIDMNLQYFEYRYPMSATPADTEEKMYMILKTLDKALVNGENFLGWVSQYAELGNRFSQYAVNKETWDQKKWAELNDLLYKNYAVKREKSLLNLPPAINMPIINLDMSEKHREIYKAFTYEVVNEAKNRNNNNSAGLIENMTNLFTYLQLAVDNPLLLKNSKKFSLFPKKLQDLINSFNYEKDFTKLQALDAIVEEECNERKKKIIIFYFHPITLECLKNHFKKGYHVISAEIPIDQRFDLVKKFEKSQDYILLASINVLNSSITITEAKAEVFIERTWVYKDDEQARGRIDRPGQTEETRYYDMCYNNSIDNLQILALQTKGKCVANLVKKNNLSSDEWKILVGGTTKEYNTLLS